MGLKEALGAVGEMFLDLGKGLTPGYSLIRANQYRQRGFDPDRGLPLYYYLSGPFPVPSDCPTVAVASPTELAFLHVMDTYFKEKKPGNAMGNFTFIQEFGVLPKDDVTAIFTFYRSSEKVEGTLAGGMVSDLVANNTIGRILPFSTKTIGMAAYIVIEVTGSRNSFIFGVPGGGAFDFSLGFLGDLMPPAIAIPANVVELIGEYGYTKDQHTKGRLDAVASAEALAAALGRPQIVQHGGQLQF
jgi:hypothetical protein